ncbi:hypothetical protein Tco_1021610 [Tanacetum coccineum]
MFIKYSTGQIPLKKSRGKVSQRKKIADDSHETVDVSKESELKPESVKRKTSSKRRVKKVTLSADDNIISDDPDTALELGKSNSKTEAKEAEAARQKNKRLQTLCKLLRKARRQARDRQVVEAQVKELDEWKDDKEGDADDEDDETESDEDDIYKYKTRVCKDEDEEMLNAEVEDF